MSLKNFLLRSMLKKQLKGVPESEQEKIFTMIEKNPDFFQQIAVEAQEKMKQGKGQMDAVMEVMKSHEDKLRELSGK